METPNPTNNVTSVEQSSRPTRNWLMWTIQVATLVIVALIGYNLSSTKGSLNDQISQLQGEMARMRADQDAKVSDVAAELDAVSRTSGTTVQELDLSRKNTEKLRQDQEKAKIALAQDLAKARLEAANGISQLQQDAESKFGEVNGQVKDVATGLDTAKQDMNRLHQDLTQQIARNSTELADLRKKGDRDYVEFTIRKAKKNEMQRIADLQLALMKTDPKRQKYDVVVLVDDHKLERKDRVANEPLQFLVGREQLRYEVVVNFVDKDLIRGYVSTPKDKSPSVALKTNP